MLNRVQFCVMNDKKPKKLGIYLLPNLLTTIGLLFGFYAIVLAISSQYQESAIAIFLAMVFDGLDGRVARLTNTQSDFGAEYDSMSDMLSFGVAPAILIYHWSLTDLGNLGWLMAFVYVASAALRLARFNTQIGIEDKNYFQGLPSPAAAALNAGLVWFAYSYQINEQLYYLAWVSLVSSALLMVSNIRYHSFKSLNFKNKSSFRIILLVLFVIVLISLKPALVLFSVIVIYSLSGILLTIWQLRQKRLLKSQRQH